MKKIIKMFILCMLVLSLACVFVACGETDNSTSQGDDGSDGSTETKTYEVALITDAGTVTDKSFNQSAWEAVEEWATENNKTYNYYMPQEFTTDDLIETAETAIDNGAKIIVTPGYNFAQAIYELQEDYPDVKFVLLDSTPNNGLADDEYAEKIADNTYCIMFNEEQAGYLAGYSAVADGETNLGFIGGEQVPAVINFGLGYLQGINDACEDYSTTASVWYAYANTFVEADHVKTFAGDIIDYGTKTIFSCGGGIWSSVADAMLESEGENLKLIGVDTNQQPIINETAGYEDLTVLTSATKDIYSAVMSTLDYYGDDEWDTIGGTFDTLGISDSYDGTYVGLPTNVTSWNFTSFDVDTYNNVVSDIADGTIVVENDNTLDIDTYVDDNLTNIIEFIYYDATETADRG